MEDSFLIAAMDASEVDVTYWRFGIQPPFVNLNNFRTNLFCILQSAPGDRSRSLTRDFSEAILVLLTSSFHLCRTILNFSCFFDIFNELLFMADFVDTFFKNSAIRPTLSRLGLLSVRAKV